jgi:hypothetical protein
MEPAGRSYVIEKFRIIVNERIKNERNQMLGVKRNWNLKI